MKNESDRRADAPDATKPLHVLLIEDDKGMREMLAEALRREGCQVTECTDAMRWLKSCVHEATAMDVAEYGATGMPYDVVVSDIRTPRVGGLDVLRILHDIHCADACPPTILITAFGDEETHRRARELGAVTVLNKPLAIRDLIERIRCVAGA